MAKPSTTSHGKRKRRIGRPPNQSSEQTRERILLAARECFARVGYERATNQEIAAAADVTAAAMYRHFESKGALWAAVVRECNAEMTPMLRGAIEGATGIAAALRAMIAEALKTTDRVLTAARFLALVPVEMQRHPELKTRILSDPGEVFTVLTSLVDGSVQRGEIAPEKAQRLLSTIISAMMGISAYADTLGPEYGEHAALGFIDLIDGRLFVTGKSTKSG
jgi:AcrR family transcriptional regulator